MILELISCYETLTSFRIEVYNDDGRVEKLIRRFSATMMIVFSSIFFIVQLVGSRIKCWCPNEYSDTKCDYANTHCYITNFYVPISNSSHLPRREELHSHKILYYQWIPYIFFLQGAMFYLPNVIWRWLYSKSGFDFDECFRTLRSDSSDQNDSEEIILVTEQIEKIILKKNKNSSKLFNNGFYLAFSYLLTKILYLSSIIFQFYVINNWFMDEHYRSYNWIFGSHLFNLTDRFPHMTLCKYEVFILNDLQTHWLQCVLPLNVYLRKAILIIYFWLIFLFCLIVGNMIDYIMYLRNGKKLFVNLIQDEKINEDNTNEILRNLNADALLVIKLLKSNTNNFYLSAIATKLYQNKTKML
ncbi:innexin unc-9-like isoform X6 [Brachionus plicatilis]|uniref:Innexin n=1 Tax=Brachionus plicatilis TaxID=10195 RepID=A0A3M7QK42_BRAPC|nr:innexin unc-9-like isoform X6 [Brachionus plicatilis]